MTPDALRQLPADIVGGPAAAGAANAYEVIEKLRAIYCSSTGHDYNQVFVPAEREWLRRAVESCQFRPPQDPIDSRQLLDRITQVESFERFLHRTFPGKTRFSIEGLDMMIPILDEIISDAAAGGRQARDDCDGPPRPAQRARPHPAEAVRPDPGGVQGSAVLALVAHRPRAGWAT